VVTSFLVKLTGFPARTDVAISAPYSYAGGTTSPRRESSAPVKKFTNDLRRLGV